MPDLQLVLAAAIQAQAKYVEEPSAQTHMLYTRALQVFAAYQVCLPSVLAESRVDFARFLPGPSIELLLGASPLVLTLVLEILSNGMSLRIRLRRIRHLLQDGMFVQFVDRNRVGLE